MNLQWKFGSVLLALPLFAPCGGGVLSGNGSFSETTKLRMTEKVEDKLVVNLWLIGGLFVNWRSISDLFLVVLYFYLLDEWYLCCCCCLNRGLLTIAANGGASPRCCKLLLRGLCVNCLPPLACRCLEQGRIHCGTCWNTGFTVVLRFNCGWNAVKF